MSAAERAFFEGDHCAHVAARDEHLRIQKKQEDAQAELRNHDRRIRAGAWYDAVTMGRGSPEGREMHIKTALSLRSSGRPEPKPRPLGQASIDAQPARKAKERYRRDVHVAKLRASSPLRSDDGKPIKPQQDAGALPLFVTANEPSLL